jgi:hypothetical protein
MKSEQQVTGSTPATTQETTQRIYPPTGHGQSTYDAHMARRERKINRKNPDTTIIEETILDLSREIGSISPL